MSELAEVERDGAVAVPMVRQAVGWLADLLPLGAGSRILDVGAGPGYATTLLAEGFPRSEVVAVDPTSPFVARATERFAELQLGDRVRAVRDGLAPERREALVLTQVLGLAYAEAAEVCEVPVGTIRSRVARAREDLLDADQTRRHGTG